MDLNVPSFTNSAQVTNPLFPASSQESVLPVREERSTGRNASWRSVDQADAPRLIRPVLRRSLERLDAAVSSQQRRGAAQAAIDVTRSAQDLRLRFEPAEKVDLARFDLWLAQMLLDARSGDAAAPGVTSSPLTTSAPDPTPPA